LLECTCSAERQRGSGSTLSESKKKGRETQKLGLHAARKQKKKGRETQKLGLAARSQKAKKKGRETQKICRNRRKGRHNASKSIFTQEFGGKWRSSEESTSWTVLELRGRRGNMKVIQKLRNNKS
jgi:hypothetical protein